MGPLTPCIPGDLAPTYGTPNIPPHSPHKQNVGFEFSGFFFSVKSSKTFISAKSLYICWFPRYDRCWLFTASENSKEHLSAFPCEPVPELPRKKADHSKPLFYRWCFKKLWRFGMKMPQKRLRMRERGLRFPREAFQCHIPCHLFFPQWIIAISRAIYSHPGVLWRSRILQRQHNPNHLELGSQSSKYNNPVASM